MEPDLAQLRALSAVVEHGTFEAAARSLHVTPSAVSQRIKALEVTAGRVLVRRTRPATVTEDGQALLRLARGVELLAAETARALDGAVRAPGRATGARADAAAPRPVTVSVAVNADSLATWALPAFAGLGDGICVDLRREDQDHSADLLRSGDVMAAITTQAHAVQGCSVTRLGAMRYVPMASPAFAARWFPGVPGERPRVDALAEAPVVVFDRKDDLQDRYLRRRSPRRLDPPRHHVPGTPEFAQAVRLGMGWGMLSPLQVEGSVSGHDLVAIDPAGAVDVPLHWQQWRLHSWALDRVAEAVVGAARAALG